MRAIQRVLPSTYFFCAPIMPSIFSLNNTRHRSSLTWECSSDTCSRASNRFIKRDYPKRKTPIWYLVASLSSTELLPTLDVQKWSDWTKKKALEQRNIRILRQFMEIIINFLMGNQIILLHQMKSVMSHTLYIQKF